MTWRGHVCLAKAKWDMEKAQKGHVWTSDFILSFCLGGSEKGGGCGRGSYWMRENNSGSSSNWNLRRSKSVFHVCMQLLPKGRTHLLLLLQHHFTVHDPPTPLQPHKSLWRLPSWLMTVSCAGPLTTLHLRPYWLNGITEGRRFQTFWWNQSTREISWFPSNPQKVYLWNICISTVLPCTLNPLTLHNHWPNNGRQLKARKHLHCDISNVTFTGVNVTLENLFNRCN